MFRRAFGIYRNVFTNSNLTLPGASGGWDKVSTTFPPEKRAVVEAMLAKLIPLAHAIDPGIPDPRIQAQEAQEAANKAAACFIATAALGSPYHPALDVLRRFRDEVLLRSAPGRIFVKQYYRWSPPLAAIVANYRVVRWATLRCIVFPAISVSRRTLSLRRHK